MAGFVIDPNLFLMGFALFTVVAAAIIRTAAKHKGRIGDWWRLTFKKSRVISVKLRMPSGSYIQRYVIPNARGFFDLKKDGMYHFNPRYAVRDPHYGIPEIEFVYQQVDPKEPQLIVETVETEIEEPKEDGTLTIVKKAVPTYIVKTMGLRPNLLKVPKRKDWRTVPAGELELVSETAQEVRELQEMGVAEAVLRSAKKNAQQAELMFYVCIGTLFVAIIGFMVVYNQVKGLEAQVTTLQNIIKTSVVTHG